MIVGCIVVLCADTRASQFEDPRILPVCWIWIRPGEQPWLKFSYTNALSKRVSSSSWLQSVHENARSAPHALRNTLLHMHMAIAVHHGLQRGVINGVITMGILSMVYFATGWAQRGEYKGAIAPGRLRRWSLQRWLFSGVIWWGISAGRLSVVCNGGYCTGVVQRGDEAGVIHRSDWMGWYSTVIQRGRTTGYEAVRGYSGCLSG